MFEIIVERIGVRNTLAWVFVSLHARLFACLIFCMPNCYIMKNRNSPIAHFCIASSMIIVAVDCVILSSWESSFILHRLSEAALCFSKI